MIRATRLGLALAAALIIPACHHDSEDDWYWSGDVQVGVYNHGPDSIYVRFHYGPDGDEYERDFTLTDDQWRVDTFSWDHDVQVKIYRLDGYLLFSAHYDWEDFDDHDGRINITVDP